MERTLIILKPDCMEANLWASVLVRFEALGARLVACKMVHLGPAVLREHYAHVADKPFYPEIEAFMSSRPVVVAVLQADGIIQKVRACLGATNPSEAAEDTLRQLWGSSMTHNICHASDSPETAAAEIKRFFKPEELFGES